MTQDLKTIDLNERGTVIIVEDGDALALHAANEIIRVSNVARSESRQALVALSGGSTPKKMGALLSLAAYREQVAWDHLQLFWGDERFVPLGSEESNAGEALRAFIDEAPIHPDDVHTWDTCDGISPEESAAKYEAAIREVSAVESGVPEFDLILLGMGDDGHTLSLFPGTKAMHNNETIVMSHHVPKLDADRITFTPLLANAAKRVVFLVGGAGKADMLKTVLEGEIDIDTYPSQVIRPAGDLVWLVDEAAAAKLEK